MIPGFVAHLWQSTLFAGVAWLITLALRKNAAQVRYWVWFIASAKFLIPFSLLAGLGALVPWRAAAPPVQTAWIGAAEQIGQPFAAFPAVAVRVDAVADGENANYFALAALVLWACGFAAIAICWLVRWKRVCVLRRSAMRASIPGDMEFAVPVMSAPGLVEPGIFGIFRPVLLLPEGIGERLDRAQFDAILAHELCHVRRRDNLTATIHMVVQAIFWFHPLVWWMGARLVDERERACDEEVLRLGSKPQVYAAGILNVCRLYVETPLTCVSGVTGANLKKRIEAIMKNRIALRLSFARKAALAVAGIAALVVPIVIGIVNAPPMRAQSKELFTSDAVSVKSLTPPELRIAQRLRPFGGPGTSDPGRVHYPAISLQSLLVNAFGVNSFQIGGPDWLESEFFAVDATMPRDTTEEQFRAMLQNLLAERFKLVAHRETKEVSGYSLVVARKGPKMKESAGTLAPPDDVTPDPAPQPGPDGFLIPPKRPGSYFQLAGGNAAAQWVFQETTMRSLADNLQTRLRSPVADATGLKAKYDFTLTISTEGISLGKGPIPIGQGRAENAPDIFSALQSQLGLRLEPRKNVLSEILVVDRMEKTPAGN